MQNTNVVGIRITGDGKDFEKALQSSGKRVEGFGKKVNDSSATLQALALGLKSAFLGAGVAASAAKLVSAADAVTVLNNRLKLATGDTVQAARAYESLFQIAQQSRVGFVELGNTFVSVSRAGQELGISQDRLLTVTGAIGNAMAISGGNAQSMQAALVQLGQGLASGVLRGEELNSVMEQSPRLAQALADGLGVPLGKLRELGKQGALTSEQVIGALEKAAPQLAREVQGATATVGQAFTVLGNSAVKFIGIADAATSSTGGLAGALIAVSDGIAAVGKNTVVLDGLRIVGDTVKVVWSDVAFIFDRTGTEIGAIGAQIAAVLRGDFAGAAFIRQELIADSKAARAALDAYQRGVVAPPMLTIDDSAERARLARHRKPGTSTGTVRGSGTPRATGAGDSELANLRARLQAESQYLVLLRDRGIEADRLNDGEKLALQLQEQLKGTLDAKTRAQKQAQLVVAQDLATTLTAQQEIRDSLKATAELEKWVSDARAKNNEMVVSHIDTLAQQNDSMVSGNQALADQLEEMGLSVVALERLRLARLDAALAQESENLLMAQSIEGNELEISQIERRIALKTTERDLVARTGDRRVVLEQERESEEFATALHNDVKNALSNAFRDSKNPALAFAEGLGNVIYTRITNSLANSLADSLLGSGKPGGGGGVFGDITKSLFSGLFGAAGGGASAFTAGGTQGMSWSFPKAGGGWAPANSLQEVNERGPEMLNVGARQYLMMGRTGGSVTPNSRLQGGQKTTMHVTNNFTISGPIDSRTQNQIAAAAGAAIQMAMHRNF